MMSMACCFTNGRERWRITHDAETGVELDATGELPASYATARASQLEKQRKGDADYIFDVPLIVAKSITGFRHDEDIEGAASEPFEVLEYPSSIFTVHESSEIPSFLKIFAP